MISFPVFLFQFRFSYILEGKDKKWFKRDIIVLISFLILFDSISFLVNIGKEMSLPGFRTYETNFVLFSEVLEKFCLAQGLRQLPRDTKSELICLRAVTKIKKNNSKRRS